MRTLPGLQARPAAHAVPAWRCFSNTAAHRQLYCCVPALRSSCTASQGRNNMASAPTDCQPMPSPKQPLQQQHQAHPWQQQQQLLPLQQQQQQQLQDEAGITDPSCWTKQMSAAYMAHGRDWAAVEDFYMQLVSGHQCLSAIGLSPAGPPAGVNQGQQQQQQQQAHESPAVNLDKQKQQRVTYKLLVSYLGGSFCGWLRGNNHSKPAVQDSLSTAIAATGLCEKPERTSKRQAKRAASRAAREAGAVQGAAEGGSSIAATAVAAAGGGSTDAAGGLQAAGVTAVEQDAAADSAEQLPQQQQQQQQSQLPFLRSGGRTDAGVSAVGQVAAFYSWQPPVPGDTLVNMINTQLQQQWEATVAAAAANPSPNIDSSEHTAGANAGGANGGNAEAPGADQFIGVQPDQLPTVCPLRVWQAEQVPRQFHPTFAATWRRYVYLLPLRTQNTAGAGWQQQRQQQQLLPRYTTELQQPSHLTPEQQQAIQAAPDVDPAIVNAMLQPLEGKRLNYYAFARDTPQGKDCECTLLVAKASLVFLPQLQRQVRQQQQQQGEEVAVAAAGSSQAGGESGRPCLAVELIADRFLRKMVRVLVGTLVREAVAAKQAQGDAAGGHECHEQLLTLLQSMDRRATAGPAPALGLCFAAVGFEGDQPV